MMSCRDPSLAYKKLKGSMPARPTIISPANERLHILNKWLIDSPFGTTGLVPMPDHSGKRRQQMRGGGHRAERPTEETLGRNCVQVDSVNLRSLPRGRARTRSCADCEVDDFRPRAKVLDNRKRVLAIVLTRYRF